jgi:Uma2 family endonuclease
MIALGSQTEKPPLTHLDLPDTDGLPMDNHMQPSQSMVLTTSIRPVLARLYPEGNYVIGEDLGFYWNQTDPPLQGCKAPDWAFVSDVPAMLDGELRRSYVLWNERRNPLIVIEYVSRDGAEERDTTPMTGKFWVYEQGIKAEYYAIFDAFNGPTLEVYQLHNKRYRPMRGNRRGHFPIPGLEIELGMREGIYGNLEATWLRFFDLDGKLLPHDLEQNAAAEAAATRGREKLAKERQRAEKEAQRAEQAADEMAALLARLKAKGIDPDSL